jgi:NAD-dependent SIR2 family protein deacetylase
VTGDDNDNIARAKAVIDRADALLIAAGAGMGVDSGLPDFRGPAGFWRAYPAFEKLGLRFEQIANPRWFHDDPHLAWGFYGHRLNLYRATPPHAGFETLIKWAKTKGEFFVFTSNVDGHFQQAGFADEPIVECHGSIHHLQCMRPCCDDIRANDATVSVDESTMRAADPLPRCPHCGGLARPNVLMFSDMQWASSRTDGQEDRFREWLDRIGEGGKRLAIVEVGAGTAVPTVRLTCERIAATFDEATLIRINPREPQVPRDGIGLPMGALAALESLDHG